MLPSSSQASFPLSSFLCQLSFFTMLLLLFTFSTPISSARLLHPLQCGLCPHHSKTALAEVINGPHIYKFKRCFASPPSILSYKPPSHQSSLKPPLHSSLIKPTLTLIHIPFPLVGSHTTLAPAPRVPQRDYCKSCPILCPYPLALHNPLQVIP